MTLKMKERHGIEVQIRSGAERLLDNERVLEYSRPLRLDL